QPGLAAGAGATVGGAMRVEQRHREARLPQMPRAPGAERARSHYDDVVASPHPFVFPIASFTRLAATRSSSAQPTLLNSVLSSAFARLGLFPLTSSCRSAVRCARETTPRPRGINRSPASAKAPS